MPLFKKLLNRGTVDIADSIGNAIDKLSTTTEEKLILKNRLSSIVLNSLSKVLSERSGIVLSESKGIWLQRGWRPITALSFVFIIVYSKFIAPVFGLPNTELEDNFWTLLTLMISGYTAGRSLEKIAEIITKNIDISFTKKKRRKKRSEDND